jgi:hypothetical protein
MNKKTLLAGAALTGLLFAVGTAAHAEKKTAPAEKKTDISHKKMTKGQCHGVNSCHGPDNSCKGHGWVAMTKEECTKAKGKFEI